MGLNAVDYGRPQGRHDASPQGSARWFENRIGCLTASRMAAAMDRLKSGESSAKRNALITEILAERMTGLPAEHYVSSAMQWGIDQEPIAKQVYAQRYDAQGKDVGFFEHPTIQFLGASPDWMCGKELVEFKCPTTTTHINYLRCQECPDDYKPQMILQLECTGLSRCWFVTFDPRVSGKFQMRRWLYEPSDDERHYVISEAKTFLDDVDRAFDQLEDCIA